MNKVPFSYWILHVLLGVQIMQIPWTKMLSRALLHKAVLVLTRVDLPYFNTDL